MTSKINTLSFYIRRTSMIHLCIYYHLSYSKNYEAIWKSLSNFPTPLEILKLLGKQVTKQKRTLQNAYVCNEKRISCLVFKVSLFQQKKKQTVFFYFEMAIMRFLPNISTHFIQNKKDKWSIRKLNDANDGDQFHVSHIQYS